MNLINREQVEAVLKAYKATQARDRKIIIKAQEAQAKTIKQAEEKSEGNAHP